MNRLHIAATALSAMLISGVTVAQDAPGPQRNNRSQGRQSFQRQRGQQGCPGGQQGRHGLQQGFRSQRGGPGMGGPQGGRGQGPSPERLKEAGATDEQLAQLKKVQEEQQLKQVDLKATAEKAQIQLKQLISSEKPNQDAIFAAVDKVSAAKVALIKSGISAKLKGREILGDEVTKKLREFGHPKGKGQDGSRRQRAPRGRAGADGTPPEKADV